MTKLQTLIAKRESIQNQLLGLADILATRELTPDEQTRNDALRRELNEINLRIAAFREDAPANTNYDGVAMIREAVIARHPVSLIATREESGSPSTSAVFKVADASAGGLVPLHVNEILDPIRTGLIYDKVGISIRSGLSGEYVWPVVGAMTASVAGEEVTLNDQKLSLSKLSANPTRIGITAYATRQSLVQSDNLVMTILQREMPLALADLINKYIFTPTADTGDPAELAGPFVGKTATSIASGKEFAGLNDLRSKVYAKMGRTNAGCYVMDEATYARLEATSRDTGSGLMIIENGKLLGCPVFITPYIGEKKVGFGDFSQYMYGFFGQPSVILDQLTGAATDTVRLTINMLVGGKTLRSDAFALAQLS